MISSRLPRQEWKTTSFRFERELITGFCLFLSLFTFSLEKTGAFVPKDRRKDGLNEDLEAALH